MFSSPIYEDQVNIVFETRNPVLFSILEDSAFQKSWKPWKPRYFALREDSTLVYRHTKDSNIKAKLDLHHTKISKMAIDTTVNPLLFKEYGISVTCYDAGIETCFRCILQEIDLQAFITAVRAFVKDASIDTDAMPLDNFQRVSEHNNQSYMRQSLAKAMDQFHAKTKYERILSRRGAFSFLPVLFDGDLVHGSWWWVIGSFLTILFTILIIVNSYNPSILGEDDSHLSESHYLAAWFCILACGVFFTLGSLAFVRAMFQDPPMRPLFSWYHVASDELLGSWLFLLGCLPLIPYSLAYMVDDRSAIYLGAFVASILLNIGMLFFVVACYPGSSGEERKPYAKRIVKCICCCCLSDRFIERHLYNDWVAGCWIVFWGSLLATVGSLLLAFEAVLNESPLQFYIYGTGFVELLFFTVGSAYFVSGSYPPDALRPPHQQSQQTHQHETIRSRHDVGNDNQDDDNSAKYETTNPIQAADHKEYGKPRVVYDPSKSTNINTNLSAGTREYQLMPDER